MTDTEPRGLLDTSTVIVMGDADSAAPFPDECLISAVTLAELSVGPGVASNQEEHDGRLVHLQRAEADFEAVPFDAAAARAFTRVATALRKAGRKSSARAYDALIAATALAHELPLYTCNPADFQGIDGLDVRAVQVPARPEASSSSS